jgi:hypothetical protein
MDSSQRAAHDVAAQPHTEGQRMKQFFTRNTVEASVWCNPCGKKTQWKITDGRPQHCLTCFGKLEAQHVEKKPEAEKQEGLFE